MSDGLRARLTAKADRMERQVKLLRTMVADLDKTLGTEGEGR